LFAEKTSGEFGILKGGPWRFLGVQLLAVVAISAWAAITTFLELLLVDKLVGMRVTQEEETLGADQVEHGIEHHSPAACALGKFNGQSNDNRPENIAYQGEEGVERAQTPPACYLLQERRVGPISGMMN